MTKLMRYLLATGLLVLIVMVVMPIIVSRAAALRDLQHQEEQKTLAISRALIHFYWAELAVLLEEHQGQPLPNIDTGLRDALLEQLQDTGISKVNIVNRQGISVYSTNIDEMGEDQSQNVLFQEAFEGMVKSKVMAYSQGVDGHIQLRQLMGVYLPIRHPDGEILGVFEMHSDVTPWLKNLKRTQIGLALGTMLSLSLIYGTVFFFVRRSAKAVRAKQCELERQALIVQQTPTILLEIDRQGRILFMNPSAEKHFPQLRESPDALTHPLLENWPEITVELEASQMIEREVIIGEKIYSQKIAYNFQSQHFDTYTYEITQIKRSEAKLLQAQLEQRALLDAIPDMMFVADKDGVLLECKIDQKHQYLQNLVGHNFHELEMIPKDIAQAFETVGKQALTQQKAQQLEYSLMGPTGQEAFYEARVIPLGGERVMSLVRDITEQKTQTLILAESEARNRSLVSAFPDLIFVVDKHGRFLEAQLDEDHPLMEPIIGRTFSEISFISDQMAHMLKGFIEKAILTRTMQVAEYSLPSVGRMSDYEARFVALDDERVLYVARDVTSRKKLEHDLRLVAQNNQRQATELELLEQLRTLMNNQTELEVLFKTVNEAVANVLGYELIGISLIRDEYLEMQHSVGYTRLLPRFPIHQGVEGRVIRNARANLVQDVKQDPDYFEVEPNTKSEVCVPLFIKAQVAGVLIVESIKRILQETDLRILTRLGSYISLAMEQAQLYSEAKANEAQYRDLYTMSQQQAETLARRNNELVLFERIRDAIANELDINGLYQAVAENLVHSFGYHSVRVFEVTETVFRPVCQIGVLVSATDIPLNQGVAARVLRNDRADLVVDVLKDPDYVALESEMLSEMSLPLHCRGEVVAILSIETLRKDNIVLTEDDLRLVSTIAEQVDVAIERAYLYQETKANETKFRELYLVTQEQSELLAHRATELELLNQVRAIISSKLEPALLFKAVTEAVSHVLGYTFVGIALIKGEYLEIQYQLGYDMTVMPSILSLGQGVIGRVAQTGQRVLVPFVADDPDYVGPTNKSISEICVPLRIQDQVVGVLNVESTHAVLGETQLETLSQVAVYVGIALEQARLYQALQSSELRYRELIENASDIIYRTDSSGKFSYTNSVVTRLLGYKEQDILGKHYLELIRPDYQAQARAFYIKQVKEKTSTTYFEFPVLSIAGEEIWLGQNVQLIWEGEALIGMQAVARDVTQRKRMEEALLKQAEELSSANADLEQFAFIAAHDLQEPLRKIQAFGDRLNLKYKAVLDEQGQDYLERMRSSATRMRTLIDDLLSFARANKQQKRELISLETLIRSVLGDLQMPIEETQATIHVGGLPTLEVDPSQMRQLFQNLLSNALKFHRPQVAPVIDIYSYRLPSGDWEIRVSDNGIGFEEQYKDRIFAVFQRLHSREKYEGTGIGLAIARRIVEGHGGCIEVSSQLGKGTTFRVTLPPTSNVSLEKTLLKKPLLEKIESVVI